MHNRNGFSACELGLLFVVVLALVLLMLTATHVDSSGQIAPTWTPRPTDLPALAFRIYLPFSCRSWSR